MKKHVMIPVLLILLLALAACGAPQTAEPAAQTAVQSDNMETADADADEAMDADHNDEMMDEAEMADDHEDGDMDEMSDDHDDEMMDDADMEDESMDGDDTEAMDDESMAAALPAWQTVALTNAVTGESFTLADFQGKTVFVEPMATWCSNCRQQQGQVREAKAHAGDDVVFVGLSVETNLPSGDLANYAQANGFDWTYAVMSVELLEGLTGEFGRTITNPPSTPHFLIRPDGSFTELSTGIHSADELLAEIAQEQG